jgi:hypothetical protein
MRHRAALAGAALAAGGLALMTGPSSADTVRILSLVDPDCCSISDLPSLDGLQTEPADPATISGIADDESERAGDSLGPAAMAIKERGGVGDDTPEGVDSVAAPEPSVLTRVLMIFADLPATVIRGP